MPEKRLIDTVTMEPTDGIMDVLDKLSYLACQGTPDETLVFTVYGWSGLEEDVSTRSSGTV